MAILTTSIYSQNITNTLGTNGYFTIDDGATTFFSLPQSTGTITLSNGINLPSSAASYGVQIGVIYKGGTSFIHNYQAPGTNGNNTFVGINAGNFTMYSGMAVSSESSNNTAVGNSSLSSVASGYSNSAFGVSSLHSNIMGYSNSAVGYNSLYSNIQGNSNSALGMNSLFSNLGGFRNSAVGYNSLYSNTEGENNSTVGYNSLYSNTTGNNNSVLGAGALYTNTTGYNNTVVGSGSLYLNTTGYSNSAFGGNSLSQNTSGENNSAVGNSSLSFNTIGSANSAFGASAGSSVTTGSNLTLIGYNAQPYAGTSSNQITLGDANIIALRCNVQTITSLSDARDKKNIQDLKLGIDFLMKLKPRLFNWDRREWYDNNTSDGSKMQNTPTAGFIAQELDKVQMSEKAEWLNLVLKENPNRLEATSGNLLPIMVKAIQDLKKENDVLKDRLTKFEKMQTLLVAEIEKIKANNYETTKVSLGTK